MRIILMLILSLLTLVPFSHAQMFPFVLPWNDSYSFITNFNPLQKQPAGSAGSLFVNPQGHLATSDGRIRFWGVNLGAGACFPDTSTAIGVADRLRKFGVNIVRYHHMDNTWTDNIWTTAFPDRSLSPARLAAFDRLFYEMKQRGIYANINLVCSRPFNSGPGLTNAIDAITDWKIRGVLGFFDQQVLTLQKQYATDLLTHLNPHTGLAYKDDPAVAFVEINNESGLIQSYLSSHLDTLPSHYTHQIKTQWNNWLATRYPNHAALAAAWNIFDQPVGPEKLLNPDFDSSTANWTLEQHNGAAANMVTTADGPGSSNALRINITVTGTEGWHVQVNQANLSVVSNTPYTLTFWIRSSSKRDVHVSLMQAHTPYSAIGFAQSIPVSNIWTKHSFTFLASTSDTQSRVNFGNLGLATGTVWIDRVSFKEGGLFGISTNENLDFRTIANIRRSEESTRSTEARRDWYRFLSLKEEKYWTNMRNFLRHTLGVKALLMGTILGCSTPNIQAQFDVIDSHAYWEHPAFPGTPWDPIDWYIHNKPMVNAADTGTIGDLSMRKVKGKPMSLTEYNHPHPNTYQAEGFFLMSAYASFHDFDAVYPFSYAGDINQFNSRSIKNYFDIDQNPVKMASFFAASLSFRRGDVKPALQKISIPFSRTDELEQLLSSWAWRIVDSRTAGENPRSGIVHGVEMAVEGTSPSGLAIGTTSVTSPTLTSDTGELVWDQSIPNKGLVKVDTPKTRMLIGFSGNKEHSFTNMRIKPATGLQNGFSCLGITVLEGETFTNASRLLITALGAVQNSGQSWYVYPNSPTIFPPPLDATITYRNQIGTAPTLAEGVNAGFFLPYYATNISVRALSSNGQFVSSLPVSNVSGGCRFHIGPSYKALWYDVRINNHLKVTNSVPLPNPESDETNTSGRFLWKFGMYPNPFHPDRDGLFRIEYNLSDPIRIRDRDEVGFDIYTVAGDLVISLRDMEKKGFLLWDGKNENGKRVARGIYFCVMTINGKMLEKKAYKIGVK